MTEYAFSKFSRSPMPIGTDTLRVESGTDITDGAGYHLRSGLYATAASFPDAAQLEHCKISGLASTNSTALGHFQSADNGAGVVVCTFNGATTGQVLVSTDGGATVSIVATGLGEVPTGVVWAGDKFLIAGNNSSLFRSAFSTNGTSWTVGGNVALTSVSSGSVRLAYNGTVVYGVGSGSTVANASAFTTTDGVTLTGRTAPSSSPLKSITGEDGVFVHQIDSTTFHTSTDGVTFTLRTAPGSVFYSAFLGGSWMLKADSNTYYVTSNFTTFTTRTIPGTSTNLIAQFSLSHDSTRVYSGVYDVSAAGGAPMIMWSSDLVKWYSRGVPAGFGNNTVWHCQGGRYFFPKGANTSTNILYTANFSNADFVGAPIMSISSPAGSGGKNLVAYRKLSD
jgi:hypothetical protein